MIFLDTHVVAWLYAGKIELFSPALLDLLRKNELIISPVVELELTYLYEFGRIIEKGDKIIKALVKEIGLKISEEKFNEIINEAI